jgi:hypothetical protein
MTDELALRHRFGASLYLARVVLNLLILAALIEAINFARTHTALLANPAQSAQLDAAIPPARGSPDPTRFANVVAWLV